MKLITAPPKSYKEDIHSQREYQSKAKTIRQKYRGESNLDIDYSKPLTDRELYDETDFFAPIHYRLRKELIETREKLSGIELQLKTSEERRYQLTKSYIKEVNDRKASSKLINMPATEQAEKIKRVIENNFVDVLDGLDPQSTSILEYKIKQVKDFFISQIRVITHQTDCLR